MFAILNFLKLSHKCHDIQKVRHDEVIAFINGMNLNKNLAILDVGCGQGKILEKLHQIGFSQLYGCDWLTRDTNDFFEYSTIDLNLNGLSKYNGNSFDLIICSDVLEHMENPTQVLREINRVMKPDAKAIITIPNAWNIQERMLFLFSANSSRYKSERRSSPFGHISFFTIEILESIFDRAKLKILNISAGDNFFQGYTLYLPKNLLLAYNVLVCATKEQEY